MVAISQIYAGCVSTVLCSWTIMLIKASSRKMVSVRGSLTEFDSDLPSFSFYLSLWETPVSLVYKMQIMLPILYKL